MKPTEEQLDKVAQTFVAQWALHADGAYRTARIAWAMIAPMVRDAVLEEISQIPGSYPVLRAIALKGKAP